ncbi:hypothetical protein ATCC90586_002207 [Pythium insidiosum]|nr:hypothetical protein ATCC90586_002207 [Pythium insidiosum]
MFPKIKLTYFDLDGRGSAVRAALHVAGIPFEDERIPFDETAVRAALHVAGIPFEDERIPFDETFQRIRDKFPFGKVPVLQVDGESIAESQAMLRFVGRLGGLYPVNNPELALLVDEILGAYDDLLGLLLPSFMEKDPEQKKLMREELMAGPLQKMLDQIEKRLQHLEKVKGQQRQQEPGLDATERDVLIHEIMVWDYVRMFRGDFIDHLPHVSPKVVDQFPHLVAIYDKVAMLPKVQEWNATRQSK